MVSWDRTTKVSVSLSSYTTPFEVHLASLSSGFSKPDHPGHCLHDKTSSLSKSLNVRKVGIGRMQLNTFTFVWRLVLQQSYYSEILVILFTEISNTCLLLTCTKEVSCNLKAHFFLKFSPWSLFSFDWETLGALLLSFCSHLIERLSYFISVLICHSDIIYNRFVCICFVFLFLRSPSLP